MLSSNKLSTYTGCFVYIGLNNSMNSSCLEMKKMFLINARKLFVEKLLIFKNFVSNLTNMYVDGKLLKQRRLKGQELH